MPLIRTPRLATFAVFILALSLPLPRAAAQDIHFSTIIPYDPSSVPDVAPKLIQGFSPQKLHGLADETPHVHAEAVLVGASGTILAQTWGLTSSTDESFKNPNRFGSLRFRPALTNKKAVPGAIWLIEIYNPPSASKKDPDATARIEDAVPCIVPFDSGEAGRVFTRPEAVVWVTAVIDAQGRASHVQIETPAARPLLALIEESLRHWTFSPARRNGKTQSASLRFPVPVFQGLPLAADPTSFGATACVEPNPLPAGKAANVFTVTQWKGFTLPRAYADFPLFLRKKCGFEASVDEHGQIVEISVNNADAEPLKPYLEAGMKTWKLSVEKKKGRKPGTVAFILRPRHARGRHDAIRIYSEDADFPPSLSYEKESLRGSGTTRTAGAMVSRGGASAVGERGSRTAAPSSGGFTISGLGQIAPAHFALTAGRVVLQLDIDAAGRPGNPRVVESNAYSLEAAAIKAALAFRYEPATDATGVPRASTITEAPFFQMRPDPRVRYAFFEAARSTPDWDRPPILRKLAQPVYPADLLSVDKKGTASAEFEVSADGSVSGVVILSASDPAFGYALQAALQASTFTPAIKGGRPISSGLKRTELFKRSPNFVPASNSLNDISLAIDPSLGPDAPITPPRELDRLPSPLLQHAPVSPAARAASNEVAPAAPEKVLLEIVIDSAGFVRSPRIVSTPTPELGYAAIQAVSGWLFTSPLKNGIPVNTRLRIPILFDRAPVFASEPTSNPTPETAASEEH